MGSGRWDSSDYESYAKTTNYVSASREEVFASRNMPPSLDPRRIVMRESVDSVDNPNSTPIILALDVTGSMGEYAELIAKESLPQLMGAILEQLPVSDPHMMFMAVDDIHTYNAPNALQVSQFEADIRIIEELRKIWLVGGGGGNNSESYDLPWYFAAKKTALDSVEKRGKKGYLFSFGDEEAPYESLTEAKLKQLFDGEVEPMTPEQALELAKKKFNVFHIVIEQGSYCRQRGQRVRETWTKMMGSNVLFLEDFKNLTALVIATMQVAEGADLEQTISESNCPAALRHAFANALSQD